MCGIAGFITAKRHGTMEANGMRMANAIARRGPDDWGLWTDTPAGVCLAHRRLAIVDVYIAGHQPMHSANERFVIAYNGEVYNHLEIRGALEAAGANPEWRGHSDTETLLCCRARIFAFLDCGRQDRAVLHSIAIIRLVAFAHCARSEWSSE